MRGGTYVLPTGVMTVLRLRGAETISTSSIMNRIKQITAIIDADIPLVPVPVTFSTVVEPAIETL